MLRSLSSLLSLALLVHLATLGSSQRVVVVNPTAARAIFNLKGVTGSISFYETQNGTNIMVNLQGLNQQISQWSIREQPADNTVGPSDRCSVDYLGGMYNTTTMVTGAVVGDLSGRFGPISSNGVAQFSDRGRAVTLQGSDSIVGRSLLLQVGTSLVCATIRSKLEDSPSDAVTMHATFISPAGGVVYFRQSGSEPTVIHGKLYFINEMAATSVEWAIYDDTVTERYRAAVCGNPTRLFDNLTARHGMLSVSDAPQPYSDQSFLFTDNMLMLSGLSSIEGRTLVLTQGGTVVSCAPIVAAESLETFQYPDSDFQIRQTSPHENSTLTMSSNVTSSSTYSILTSAIMTNGLCPIGDEIYNPLGTTPPGSNLISRTPDLFPKGDISGKFGHLMGPSQELSLTELPMYGPFTLLGRTMREVGTNRAQPYRSCNALFPSMEQSDNIRIARANFIEGPIGGAIYFFQKQDLQGSGQPGMTNIIVDLYYTDSTMATTTGHNWHVHVDLPQPGVDCSIAVGWHFNPFGVDLANNYGPECGSDAPIRCESGDLSGKHGQLTFSPLGPNRKTESFVDSNLQLDGEYAIVGRSIGLHRPVLFSCAEVKAVQVNDAQFDVVVAFPESATFERVTFSQQLVDMASLSGRVNPSDILVLQEEVGAIQSATPGIVCATALMKITASTAQQANTYASTIQNSVCVKYANNGCMAQLPDFERMCTGAKLPNGAAQAVGSFSIALIISGLLIFALF